MKKIHKIGLALIRDDKLLMVTDEENYWKFPGGTPIEKENGEQCLQREIKEELGADLKKETLKFVGKFIGPSGSDKNVQLEFDLYVGEVEGELKPQTEVKELHWFDKKTDWGRVSWIARYKLIPALIQRSILK